MQISQEILSKNYDLRPEDKKQIKYVILHYTELCFEQAITMLCSQGYKVSAHYVLRKDGKIFQLVQDQYRAWHAGISRWKEDTSLNDVSIGIEIENNGSEEFSEEQYISLAFLCNKLKSQYQLELGQFLGHSDIAPSRKIDPGMYFRWDRLYKEVFDIDYKPVESEYSKILLTPQKILQIKQALQSLGYGFLSMGDEYSKNFSDVLRAFQLHFAQKSIIRQGGYRYLQNLENIFEWDSISENVLEWCMRTMI